MERQFRRFLARKLSLHVSSVEIQGIVSNNNYTWFIIQVTPPLLQALIDMVQGPNANAFSWKRFVGYVAAAAPTIGVVGVAGAAAVMLVRAMTSH